MMEKTETYLVEVILKKVVGTALLSGAASLAAFVVSHADFMQQLGLTYYPDFIGKFVGPAPTGEIYILEVSTFKAWAIVAGPPAVMALFVWVWHHLHATATGAPQSGDMRVTAPLPIVGGDRESDPKKGV